jgi:hypothetical protein
MFFLIRIAFWLSIVILLLPTGPGQSSSSSQQVGAVDALAAAGAAVSDMRQFCSRQPEACVVGSQAAAAFGEKAQAGAKMIYEFLIERMAAEQPNDRGSKSTVATPPADASGRRSIETTGAIVGTESRDTLTPADRAPAWRGPAPASQQPARQSS